MKEDYEELMLQISDVMREANRVRPILSHEQAIKNIRGIVERHGKWITVNPLQENDDGAFRCSCCKEGSWHWGNSYHYCPNCGAKMER